MVENASDCWLFFNFFLLMPPSIYYWPNVNNNRKKSYLLIMASLSLISLLLLWIFAAGQSAPVDEASEIDKKSQLSGSIIIVLFRKPALVYIDYKKKLLLILYPPTTPTEKVVWKFKFLRITLWFLFTLKIYGRIKGKYWKVFREKIMKAKSKLEVGNSDIRFVIWDESPGCQIFTTALLLQSAKIISN